MNKWVNKKKRVLRAISICKALSLLGFFFFKGKTIEGHLSLNITKKMQNCSIRCTRIPGSFSGVGRGLGIFRLSSEEYFSLGLSLFT